MAKKISKSDTTPEMEAKAKEYAEIMRQRKSQHFAIGTGIVYNRRRYTVNQIVNKTLIAIDDDGKAHRIENPYFLR